MKGRTLGKYSEIIISIAIFIILDSGILALNYYISYQISDDANALQSATRQTRLSQSILHQLYQVRDDLDSGLPIEHSVGALATTTQQFDAALNAFKRGDLSIGNGNNGNSLLVDPNHAAANQALLQQIADLWAPYRSLLAPVINAVTLEPLNIATTARHLETAIASGREINPQMLELSEKLSASVAGLAQNKLMRLRTILAAGIFLAVVNFIVILFHFIRQLTISDRAAEIARRETDNIMATVSDGLFLLDRHYGIGGQYSKSLEDLLHRQTLGGQNFIELISPMVSEKTRATTVDYLDVLFSEHAEFELLSDLNPLEQVEMQIKTDRGQFETRHFAFRFTPVYVENTLRQVLVSLTDVTAKTELERSLKKAQADASAQMDLLLSIIHLPPQELIGTLNAVESALQGINEQLKQPGRDYHSLYQKKTEIARKAHRIKGDCAASGLSQLEQSMHRLETHLTSIGQHNELHGDDFLPVAVELKHALGLINQLHTTFAKLDGVHQALANAAPAPDATQTQQATLLKAVPGALQRGDEWLQNLHTLADRIANTRQHQLRLSTDKLNLNLISGNHIQVVKDALVQLVRNAAYHGIESPATRAQFGKNTRGLIEISTTKTPSSIYVEVKDDGRGINLKAIREQLKKQGMAADDVAAMSAQDLVEVIFQPGFSTATNDVNLDAGHGIGLDLVRDSLKDCGGRIRLKSRKGQYTAFTIQLPRNPALESFGRANG